MLVLTQGGKVWQQVNTFVDSFTSWRDDSEGGHLGLIVLLPDPPPKKLIDASNATTSPDIAFVVGDWRDQYLLKELGVDTCSVAVAMSCNAPSRNPENDVHSFFLLKTIAKSIPLSADT